MDVNKRTLRELFDPTGRLEAPLFQRPYVWRKEKNWQPLWESVQNVADSIIGGFKAKPHFLGAIVLDQLDTPTATLSARQIIDGQQRLTTLQLALASIRDLCSVAEQEAFQKQFAKLTDNNVPLSKDADDVFKIWPTNSDRWAFRSVMNAGSSAQVRRILSQAPDDEPLIPSAYLYFEETISSWLGPVDTETYPTRLATLCDVFEKYLTLVVIDLGKDDDPQEIFETLNARGMPLLPADLVKNFLFHRAEKDGSNATELYRLYWSQFDTHKGFWRRDISQGRFKRPRLDWFLQYYLTLTTNDEVFATELFSTFRRYVRDSGKSTEKYLQHFRDYSDVYKSFESFPKDTVEGLFFYRLGELETTTVFPLLLEVFKTHNSIEDRDDLVMICRDIESFLVRRQICQLTPKNYNRFFLDVIQQLRGKNDFSALALRSILLEQTVDTSRWPNDDEFARAWLTTAFYKRLVRNRLRMILEALDDAMQSDKSEKVEIKEKLTIEHLMPQDWETNWPLPAGVDLEEATEMRNRMVHTIGNLTLLTKKLNPSVSNGPWLLKRKEIAAHSAIAMNRRFYDVQDWNEDSIFERTKELLKVALQVWPRPGSATTDIQQIRSMDSSNPIETWRQIARIQRSDTASSNALAETRIVGVGTPSAKKKRGLIKLRIQDTNFEAPSIPDLYRGVLKYLYEQGHLDKLNLPIASGSKRYIVAREPKHQGGNPFLVDVEYLGYHMEAHNNRRAALAALDNLLAMCGLGLDRTITIQEFLDGIKEPRARDTFANLIDFANELGYVRRTQHTIQAAMEYKGTGFLKFFGLGQKNQAFVSVIPLDQQLRERGVDEQIAIDTANRLAGLFPQVGLKPGEAKLAHRLKAIEVEEKLEDFKDVFRKAVAGINALEPTVRPSAEENESEEDDEDVTNNGIDAQ
jgi:uncharacterized protein with ParB-like and HNH nuclease domain